MKTIYIYIRNDFRLKDNPALYYACKLAHSYNLAKHSGIKLSSSLDFNDIEKINLNNINECCWDDTHLDQHLTQHKNLDINKHLDSNSKYTSSEGKSVQIKAFFVYDKNKYGYNQYWWLDKLIAKFKVELARYEIDFEVYESLDKALSDVNKSIAENFFLNLFINRQYDQDSIKEEFKVKEFLEEKCNPDYYKNIYPASFIEQDRFSLQNNKNDQDQIKQDDSQWSCNEKTQPYHNELNHNFNTSQNLSSTDDYKSDTDSQQGLCESHHTNNKTSTDQGNSAYETKQNLNETECKKENDLKSFSILKPFLSFKGNVIFEPKEIASSDGKIYKNFAHFKTQGWKKIYKVGFLPHISKIFNPNNIDPYKKEYQTKDTASEVSQSSDCEVKNHANSSQQQTLKMQSIGCSVCERALQSKGTSSAQNEISSSSHVFKNHLHSHSPHNLNIEGHYNQTQPRQELFFENTKSKKYEHLEDESMWNPGVFLDQEYPDFSFLDAYNKDLLALYQTSLLSPHFVFGEFSVKETMVYVLNIMRKNISDKEIPSSELAKIYKNDKKINIHQQTSCFNGAFTKDEYIASLIRIKCIHKTEYVKKVEKFLLQIIWRDFLKYVFYYMPYKLELAIEDVEPWYRVGYWYKHEYNQHNIYSYKEYLTQIKKTEFKSGKRELKMAADAYFEVLSQKKPNSYYNKARSAEKNILSHIQLNKRDFDNLEAFKEVDFWGVNVHSKEFETLDKDLQKQIYFQKWCYGKTGYPIVDAGMHELLNTGYMNNRARMVVASFLTKNLMIAWKNGEEWFKKHLLDYDLENNVGNWHWTAGVGFYAYPYFRVFNPYLQSEKLDPEGIYIKKWVPELRHLDKTKIHNPPKGYYIPPIVSHKETREHFLKAMKGFKIL